MRYKITHLFICLNLSIAFGGKAQSIVPSEAYVQACYYGVDCFSISESAQLYYNETKRELYLWLDFSKFKTGKDSLDEWLTHLESTKLLYKAQVNTDYLMILSNHNSSSETLKGRVKLNGIEKNVEASATFYDLAAGVIYMHRENNKYDKLRVNLTLSIVPKDFKLDKKKHHLSKTIVIRISQGYINVMQPGMTHLLGDFTD